MSAKFKQKGFTLIETIISIAIVGIIGTGIATFLSQVIIDVDRSSSQMQALQQVEKAGYWVGQETEMAQTVTPGANSGFPLQLSWTDWNGDSYQSTFAINGGKMQLSLVINGRPPILTLVAQNINSDSTLTNCAFSGGELTLKVTATVGKESETRTYQLKPRPG